MAEEQKFRLNRIYLKDSSFESPNAPDSFKIKTDPTIDVEVRVTPRKVGPETYEVTLTGIVSARAEGTTLFLCEVQQCGLFRVRGFEAAEIDRYLHVACPKQLFPFLRETIASLTMRGGFVPVQITFVDFDKIYAERNQTAAQA